jgi:hypothetical protein
MSEYGGSRSKQATERNPVSLPKTVLAAFAVLLLAVPSASAATRYLSPSGSDSSNCISTPCASFARAYNQAASGDVIVVGPGVYPARQETPDGGTKTLTFRGEPGNKVRQLINNAANVTFDGLDVDAGGGTTTWAVFESHAENVTLKNSRVGNVVDEKGALLGGWSSTASMNVVIDNVHFHDVIQQGEGVHNECLYSMSPGVVIRNSTFTNCATMDLMVTRGFWWGQPTYGGITIENNVFAHSTNGSDPRWHYYGFLLHGEMGQLTNARIVNNTFETPTGGFEAQYVNSASGVWANNIGGGWDCLPGMTYAGNVGKKCGASDTAVNPSSSCAPPACPSSSTMPVGWTSPAQFDFTLKAGSPAIGAASAQYAPERDRRGYRRDGSPDAGAYEYGAVPDAGAPSNQPGGLQRGARWKLRRARLVAKTICHVPRRGCPASTKLQLRLGRPAKLSVRLRKAGRTLRSVTRKRVKRYKALRIRAAGLPSGRYRVLVRATDATGKRSALVRLRLRVR